MIFRCKKCDHSAFPSLLSVDWQGGRAFVEVMCHESSEIVDFDASLIGTGAILDVFDDPDVEYEATGSE